MTNKIKVIIAFTCLAVGVVYQFYYQGEIVIIDQEYTDFLSGLLCGAGGGILLVSIFRKDKKQYSSGTDQ